LIGTPTNTVQTAMAGFCAVEGGCLAPAFAQFQVQE
jgi:hypothetical protein